MSTLCWVLCGTGFTFAMTCAGAATVVLFRRAAGADDRIQRLCMGFAAGVMVAAAVFSLLLPAMEMTAAAGGEGWIPACGGFAVGAVFLLALDAVIARLQTAPGGGRDPALSRRNALLFSAMTVHNVPEGMSVGLAFALVSGGSGDPALYAAVALAVGIGVQNFPEGAAISLPFRQNGMRTGRAFLLGCLSGAVEPLFGLLTALLAVFITPLLPWLLAFAAGAMLCVAVKELIPAGCAGDSAALGTIGAMSGFLIMMALDVTLG